MIYFEKVNKKATLLKFCEEDYFLHYLNRLAL